LSTPIKYVWPPNYVAEFARREQNYLKLKDNHILIEAAKKYYSNGYEGCIAFIEDWVITYDPRNSNTGIPTKLPFILFPRQKDFVRFIVECLIDEENGLVEKSRDMGATWLCCSIAVWLWLFYDGSSAGFGSRKEQLVDKIGDPDSIFEKIRMILKYIPSFFIPAKFNDKIHSSYMKLINPENSSTITGESGDNIGRGGRKKIYFKDESAHYERPELIEASLGDNTNCQIDISSVNGTGNIFHRRRIAGTIWEPNNKISEGKTRIFIFDWRDHPYKTQDWYDKRKKTAEEEGLYHIFAQEVDRDYSASTTGIVIPAKWVKAAIDFHKHPKFRNKNLMEGLCYSSLDVADNEDGMGDKNAQATRKGITLFHLDCWPYAEDTGETTNRAILNCSILNADEFHYDCIGVGSGVKAETNRLIKVNQIPKYLKVIAWNAAKSPLDADKNFIEGDKKSPLNKDLFASLKSQGWWQLRLRFERTFKVVTHNADYPIDKLINIRSDIENFHQLQQELSQPTYSKNGQGKIVIDKKPDGTKSPNLADAVMQSYWPYKPIEKRVGIWGSNPLIKAKSSTDTRRVVGAW